MIFLRRMKTPAALPAAGVLCKRNRKKRGRKEDLRSRKGAVHGFRNLSAIKIILGFEQQIAELKTKFYENMNLPYNPSSLGSKPSKMGSHPSRTAVRKSSGLRMVQLTPWMPQILRQMVLLVVSRSSNR